MTHKRHRTKIRWRFSYQAVQHIVDLSIGEFAGEEGKPSQNCEGLLFMEICGIIKGGWVTFANLHFHIARGNIILLDKGIIIASHPVVNMECENSVNFGG